MFDRGVPVNGGLDSSDLEYFDNQRNSDNPEYWHRMGWVDLSGKRVLDIGCGFGALSIEAAERGAEYVLGVDIEQAAIDFARLNLEQNYPQLIGAVEFQTGRVEDIPGQFDVVISKDAFEHIEDLPAMMRAIGQRLNDYGMLVVGFSPLYYSPFGDHYRYFLHSSPRIPWIPAVLPERVLFRLASRRCGHEIRAATDVGLNKLTPAQFRSIVSEQGWEVVAWRTNSGDKAGMAIMSAFARFKPLEKYFTVNIYAKLRKPKRSGQASLAGLGCDASRR